MAASQVPTHANSRHKPWSTAWRSCFCLDALGIGLFFGVQAYYAVAAHADLSLKSFDQLSLGQPSKELVDVQARVLLYYHSLAAAVLAYLAAMLAAGFALPLWLRQPATRQVLNYACAGAVLVQALALLAGPGNLFFVDRGPLFFFSTAVLLWLVEMTAPRKAEPQYPPGALAVFQILLAFGLCYAWQLLASASGSFGGRFLVVLAAASLAALLWARLLPGGLERYLAASGPWISAPLVLWLCGEGYLIANQHGVFAQPRLWAGAGLLLPALWSAARLVRGSACPPEILQRRLRSGYLPVAVGVVGLTMWYNPMTAASTELYELANPALGVLRTFKFGEWPLLDYLNSHLFSELLFQFIYVGLHGFNGTLDFMNYAVLERVLAYVGFYFLFAAIFDSGVFAFLLLLFFPYITRLPGDYLSFAPLGVFPLYALYRNFSLGACLGVAAWGVFLTFWRIDLGVANFWATALALVVCLHKHAPAAAGRCVRSAAAAALLVLAAALLLRLGLALFWHGDLGLSLRQALNYFDSAQAYAYGTIASFSDVAAWYHYVVFPLLTAALLLWIFSPQASARLRARPFVLVALVYFIGFYFGNAPRGLVRHGFAESQDLGISSLWYMLPAMLPMLFLKPTSVSRYLVASLAAFFTIHGTARKEGLSGQPLFQTLASRIQDLRLPPSADRRLSLSVPPPGFAEAAYLPFKRFLDENLPAEATFLDFSNSPMLYFYTGRRVPSYFNQPVLCTHNDFLQQAQLKSISAMDIPVVVFSHWPPARFFDEVDGLSNTLRHGLTALHIYRNYEPYALVNNLYIWIRRDFSPRPAAAWPRVPAAVSGFVFEDDLGLLPYALARSHAATRPPLKRAARWTAPEIAELQFDKASLDRRLGSGRVYLRLRVQNPQLTKGRIVVTYQRQSAQRGKITFTLQDRRSAATYDVPLFHQYNWHGPDIDRIVLEPTSPTVKVSKAVLIGRP